MSRSVQQATLRAWAPGPSHRGGRVGGAWLWTTTEGQIYWIPWCHTWADCASCTIHVSSHQTHERRGVVPGPRALPQDSRGKAVGVHTPASTSHTVCHRSVPRSPTEDSTLGRGSQCRGLCARKHLGVSRLLTPCHPIFAAPDSTLIAPSQEAGPAWLCKPDG